MTETRRRFLFVTWDGAGAVIVEARLVRRLLDRGHSVTVFGPPSIRRELLGVDCDFVDDTTGPPYDAVTDYPPDELLWLRDHVWFGNASAQAAAVVALAAEIGASAVVVHSLLFGAMAGAQATGLPTAATTYGLYGLRSLPQDLDVDHPYRVFWEAGLGVLNAARASLGLAPVASVFDQRDAMDRFLLMTIRELDDPETVIPANARYVGPPLEQAAAAEPATFSDGTPTVLVSFSTSNMDQRPALQRVLDGLAELPVRVVLTTGRSVAGAELESPGNTVVYDHLPHSAVLPHAALVVTHAGHGTVVAALAHGVPLLCMPMGRDQHGVAARVAAVGAGMVVDAKAPPEEIRAAARAVMTDPRYRTSALTIKDAIDKATQEDAAVRELESLAGR